VKPKTTIFGMDDQSGFTLVEVIVSVLLLGFIAVGAIFFIFSGVSGYIFSKQASALSQKANLALARITKEFSGEMLEIESTTQTPDSVKYVYQYNPEKKRYIVLEGAGTRKEVKIAVGDDPPTPEDTDVEGVLIDQVSDFTLTFKKCDDSAWTVSDDMDDLCKIVFTLTLFINSYDDDTVAFTTTISLSGHDYIIG